MNSLWVATLVLLVGAVWFGFMAAIAPVSPYSIGLTEETALMLSSYYGNTVFARLDFTWPTAL